MRLTSVATTPDTRRHHPSFGPACGLVTVLLISASVQLLTGGSPASAEQRRRDDVRVTLDVLPPIAQPGREPADP